MEILEGKLYTLKHLEGIVVAVTLSQWFRARITDMADISAPEQEAIIEILSLPKEQHSLITVGAIFEWILSYDMTGGMSQRRRKLSKFVFKPWTREEIRATRNEDD